jgi:hypothetical protein
MERIPLSVGLVDKTSNILVDENEVVAGIDAGR